MASNIRLITQDLSGVQFASKVLKANEYQLATDAQELIEAARQQAAAIIEAAKSEAIETRKQGYRDGLEKAHEKTAQRLITAKLRANQMMEMAETDLVSLVKLTVERLFGDFDDERKIIGLVQTSLQSMRNDYRVQVRVAPSMEVKVKQRLPEIVGQQSTIEYFDVIADASLACDECVLEGDGGVIRCSVSAQLSKLNDVVQAALGD